MSKTTEKFSRCGCNAHALVSHVDKEDKLVYISLWSYGRGDTLNWKDQLKYIWQIFTKSKPYSDEIVFDYSDARDLGKFLVEHCTIDPEKAPRMSMSREFSEADQLDEEARHPRSVREIQ